MNARVVISACLMLVERALILKLKCMDGIFKVLDAGPDINLYTVDRRYSNDLCTGALLFTGALN